MFCPKKSTKKQRQGNESHGYFPHKSDYYLYQVVAAGVLPKEKYEKTKAGPGKLGDFLHQSELKTALWMKPADYRNRSSEQSAFSKRSKVIEVNCEYLIFQNV